MKKVSRYTPEQIANALADINELSDEQQYALIRALSVLDKELVDRIAQEVFFVGADPSTRGYYIPRSASIIKERKTIIFYTAKLFAQDSENVTKDILHEIAHHVLKHKSIFDFNIGEEHKMELQEKAADRLIGKWLS